MGRQSTGNDEPLHKQLFMQLQFDVAHSHEILYGRATPFEI